MPSVMRSGEHLSRMLGSKPPPLCHEPSTQGVRAQIPDVWTDQGPELADRIFVPSSFGPGLSGSGLYNALGRAGTHRTARPFALRPSALRRVVYGATLALLRFVPLIL